jgi:P27 family predicted phage terminase small subunit
LWRKLAAQIDGLQAGDVHALRLLVEAILNARQQRKLIGEEGEVITPPNGTCYLNPRYKLVSEYEKTAIRLLKEFGLSPASRRRTGQRGTDNSVDELEAFIG